MVPVDVLRHRRAVDEDPVIAVRPEGLPYLALQFSGMEVRDCQRRPRAHVRPRPQTRPARIEPRHRNSRAIFAQCAYVRGIDVFIRQSKQIHFMPRSHRTQLMKGANLVALVRWIRDAMTKVKNSHDRNLVGAAGFEPTTSLEFRQGALTAELYAYVQFSSNRRYPSNQSWSEDLRPGIRHLLPQNHRQPELLVNRTELGNFLRPDELILVREFGYLHRPR